MAWLARVGDLWSGRRIRLSFVDSGATEWSRWYTGQSDENESACASSAWDLDIDVTEAESPVDFFSSSFDLMQGLTVTELSLDAVPADLRPDAPELSIAHLPAAAPARRPG
jgi:hypothetical protein